MNARDRLPSRRDHTLIDFDHAQVRFSMSVSRFKDGRPAEIFLSCQKSGSALEALARDAAIILSIALQHSADLQVIKRALTADADGSPSSLIGAALSALAILPLPPAE